VTSPHVEDSVTWLEQFGDLVVGGFSQRSSTSSTDIRRPQRYMSSMVITMPRYYVNHKRGDNVWEFIWPRAINREILTMQSLCQLKGHGHGVNKCQIQMSTSLLSVLCNCYEIVSLRSGLNSGLGQRTWRAQWWSCIPARGRRGEGVQRRTDAVRWRLRTVSDSGGGYLILMHGDIGDIGDKFWTLDRLTCI